MTCSDFYCGFYVVVDRTTADTLVLLGELLEEFSSGGFWQLYTVQSHLETVDGFCKRRRECVRVANCVENTLGGVIHSFRRFVYGVFG